jgi:hypothetical protein
MTDLQPGEWAIIKRNTQHLPCIESHLGSVVQVTEPVTLQVIRRFSIVTVIGFVPAWFYRGELRCPSCGGPVWALVDADLEPLRDRPGDDEMVQRLGKASELPVFTSVVVEVGR